jgi:hypothetical protein
MKKLVCIGFLVCLIIAFSACSQSQPEASGTQKMQEMTEEIVEETDMSSSFSQTTTNVPEILIAAPLTAAEIRALPPGACLSDMNLPEETIDASFFAQEIPDEIFERMDGVSYKEGCPVTREELSYCRVLYVGPDAFTYIGELVVNERIAEDILEIFRELYDAGYKIGKMVLVDDYDGDDNLSIADNNTSAFNFRIVNHTTTLSRHAYGLAVDINPLYNPWIYEKDGQLVVDPPAGEMYADRTLENDYYLTGEDLCTRLFLEHGFSWGGDWEDSKDYQHFSMTP